MSESSVMYKCIKRLIESLAQREEIGFEEAERLYFDRVTDRKFIAELLDYTEERIEAGL